MMGLHTFVLLHSLWPSLANPRTQLLIPHAEPRPFNLLPSLPLRLVTSPLLLIPLPKPLLPRHPFGVELEDQIAQGVQCMIEILGRLIAAFLVLVQLRLG